MTTRTATESACWALVALLAMVLVPKTPIDDDVLVALSLALAAALALASVQLGTAMTEFLGRPVSTFPQGTRTAAEAAAAVGCEVAQIVKSLVFRRAGGDALLVLVSGRNRVDERKVEALVGEAVGKADAAFVRSATGFAIGGVPPAGHPSPLETLVDEALLEHDEVWAAAGTPRTVFPIAPRDLVGLTGGRVGDVAA